MLNKLNLDAQLKQDIQNIVQKIAAQSEGLQAVRPPTAELVGEFKAQTDEIAQYRGRPLYWPYISSGLGRGAYVLCQDGSVKLDLVNGIGVHILGHSHPRVMAATVQAALQDVVNQGHLQPGQEYIDMSRKLVKAAQGSRLKHAWLTTCGTMANENALKMARQKNSPARFVIGVENQFSGRSTMMAELTDNPEYKQGLPSYDEVLRIPFYDKFDPKSGENSLRIFREHVAKHAGQISAFSFEPMIGEGGYRSAPREFFIPIFEECRKHKIAIWADEVQTFLRTGEAYAFQAIGISDYIDLCTVAKTIQLGATLYTEEYNPKPGLIAGTFAGGTAALAAGNVVLDEMSNGFYGPEGKIQKIHRKFITEMNKLINGSCKSLLEDPDGMGLMAAVTPFSGDKDKVNKLIKVMFNNGLMAYSCGKKPMRVRFLLPAVLTDTDMEAAAKIFEQSILEVAKG